MRWCKACSDPLCAHSDLEFAGVVPPVHGDGNSGAVAPLATGEADDLSGRVKAA